MKKLFLFFLAASFSFCLHAQTSYYYPPGYFGLLNNQSTSAQAQGMGFTTLTKSGIENSFYNPAAIGSSRAPIQAFANYANGHSYRPDSRYYFVGGAFKLKEKFSVGLSYFTYRNPDPIWTTIIGGQTFDTDFFSQRAISILAAYEIMQGLHVGISANMMQENAINGEKTNSDFMPSLGLQYERSLALFKSEKVQNQRIFGAFSLFNFLFNGETNQEYEGWMSVDYLPIILRLGGGYAFQLPLKPGFTAGKGYFEGGAQAVDLRLDLQFQDYLPGGPDTSTDHELNTAFGVGAEAWFFERIALRMGYFSEKGPSGRQADGDLWVTGNRAGFSWGYGTLIPTHQLTDGKVPFDLEVNLVTGKQITSLDEKIYTHPGIFADDTFQFSFGLNLLWR
ncbi:PorV/PorQ family protein [Algoriphagus namhaensis]